MTTEANLPYEYKVGGGLFNDSPHYIRRQADDELYNNLLNGEFCYVLNSRQTGKTSLITQTISHLEAEDIKCVYIYLPKCGGKEATPEQLYSAFLHELVKKLNLAQEVNFTEQWNQYNYLPSYQERLVKFTEENILEKFSSQIVVFIDEIDNLLLRKFTIDEILEFFNFIEFFFNKKLYSNKINFALFGVATLDDFIQNNEKLDNFFKIGKSVDLPGFRKIEARYLEKGLEKKVANTRLAIREVLNWTNGQPFLTNKICKLIQDLPSPIPKGQEKQGIAKLVQSEIIENWEKEAEEEYEKQHLITIRDQILVRGRGSSRLLELYKQILQKGEIYVDKSNEQLSLRISGLVIKEEGKLKVNNKIYKTVFNLEWVEQEINNLRPYELSLEAWLKSNRQASYHLLWGNKLKESLIWIFSKKHYEDFSNEELDFLDYSIKFDATKEQRMVKEEQRKIKEQKKQIQDLQNKIDNQTSKANRKKKSNKFTIPTTVLVSVLIGFVCYPLIDKYFFNKSNPRQLETTERTSSGENILFLGRDNYMYQGTEHFKKEQFKKAKSFFEKAVEKDPNDPEALIYLNNTKARLKTSDYFFNIAVTIPINNNPKSAKEILRGIAYAQEEINENRHNNLLIITIFNDRGNPKSVAQEIINNNNMDTTEFEFIEGVIAYHVNDETLKIYNESKLAVISPIPHDSNLNSKRLFFQTSFPNQKIALKLAKYTIKRLDLKKSIIFYDNTNAELAKEFKIQFKGLGGDIVKEQKFSDFKVDIEEENIYKIIQECYDNQIEIIVLFPSEQSNEIALTIAEYNNRLAHNQFRKHIKIQLIASSEMYNPETVIKGGSTVKDLLIVVPWEDNNTFGKAAKVKWQGKISWRTATSYDAVKALVKSLNQLENKSTEITPENILKTLPDVNLSEIDTSGNKLQFSQTGERYGEPSLVIVAPKDVHKDVPTSEGTAFDFKRLE